MADDKESKGSNPSNNTEQEILQMLKGGFETEHILQQRVRAPKADAESEADAES